MINEVRKSGKGEVYNVGGHTECTNNQIGDIIVEQLGVSRELIRYVGDRLRNDRRYAIDAMNWVGSRSILLKRDLLRRLIGTGGTKLGGDL